MPWARYTPCGSAAPPHQSGPECAVEHKAELAPGAVISHFHPALYIFYTESLRKYTGWCVDDLPPRPGVQAERLFGRIRERSAALGLPRPTAILYWNSMFDFSMYAAHQKMLDLEAERPWAVLPCRRPSLYFIRGSPYKV
jgi:hypothetical protein